MDSSRSVLLVTACFATAAFAGGVLATKFPPSTNQLPRCNYEQMKLVATQPAAPDHPEKLAHHVMKHCQSSVAIFYDSDESWHMNVYGPPTKFFHWNTGMTIQRTSPDSAPTITNSSQMSHF